VHPFNLTVNGEDTREKVSLSGEFTNDEWQLLEDYLTCLEELFGCRLLHGQAKCSLNIKWDRGSEGIVTAELPPLEDVRSFLHTIRPLLLQSEPTSFYHINNLLAKHLAHPYLRALLGAQRKTYSGGREQSVWTIRVDNRVVNSEETLHTWLNAYEYHRDKDKQGTIDDLAQMLPLPALKAIFIQMLMDKTEALFQMARLVRLVLGKQSGMKFMVPL